MSKIPDYEGPAFPLSSPIAELTATCTAPYNHRAVGFRNCESAFHLASKILGGRDIIEEFFAANIWRISYGWAPTEILFFNVNWAAQEVPFPRFGVQLPEDRSTNDFMDEIEKKVNAMIGESTMNEYKDFKNLVKHKKRINRVFSEVCGDKSFCSRNPGIKTRTPAVAVASYPSEPSKISRRSSSKKRKDNDDGTPSATVCPEKTKYLESNKRKHQSTEGVTDVELQAATSLTGLSRKKTKKAVKKVATVEVRLVPAAFDDDFPVEPTQKGFPSWPFLQFYFPDQRTPSSENEFMDIGSFSDVAEEAAAKAESFVAVVPQPVHHQEEASPEFTRDLELTIHKDEYPVQDVPLLETREDLPKGQDHSPSADAFNKSFGTSHRGELLSVGCEVARNRDGASRILTLWKSPALIDEIGEGGSEQSLHSLGQAFRDSGKEPRSSSKKTSVSLGKASASLGKKVTMQNLSKKGSSLFINPFASKFYDFLLMTFIMRFFRI
jgi:hypothetical protein